jgi:hypothetical protein
LGEINTGLRLAQALESLKASKDVPSIGNERRLVAADAVVKARFS